MTPITFPPGYRPSRCIEFLQTNWPNAIEGENFVFSSLRKDGYNCVAFALGEENKDLMMTAFAKKWDLSEIGLNSERLAHSVSAYAKVFKGYYGFEDCDDDSLEAGYEKIVLYECLDDDGEISFSHIAIQVGENCWRSKLAFCEDVEHTIDALNGAFYGQPVRFLKRKSEIKIRHFLD